MMRNVLRYLCVLLVGTLVGWMISKSEHLMHVEENTSSVQRDTTTILSVDTATVRMPEASAEQMVKTQAHRLPVIRQGGGRVGGQLCAGDITECKGTDSTGTYGTGAGGMPRHLPDSMMVEVPITQLHYKDSLYEAWVSGFSQRLDSLWVYPRKETIMIKEYRSPKRWHVVVSAGYAMTPRGFQPYIGVGVAASIYSF